MAKAFHHRVAELVAAKRNEEYKDIISLLRTKISFALLKSALVSVRGYIQVTKGTRTTDFLPFVQFNTTGPHM